MSTVTSSTPTSAPAPAAPTPRAPQPTRSTPREIREHGETFDRLLSRKAGAQEGGDGDDAIEGEADGDATAEAFVLPPPPSIASLLAAPALAAPPRAVAAMFMAAPSDANVDAAKAAFGAATTAAAGPLPIPGAGTDAAAWQVTLNDPRGVAVELHATRAAGTGAEAAPWALTIGAGARDAALLAQHTNRLNERLRARAVTLSHVRIESDDEAAHSD